MKIDGFPPPFSFCRRQKENGGGAVKRKNAFSLCNPDAPRPLAQRDAALNRSAQSTQLLREHGRSFPQTSGPRTPCCTPQSSGKTRI